MMMDLYLKDKAGKSQDEIRTEKERYEKILKNPKATQEQKEDATRQLYHMKVSNYDLATKDYAGDRHYNR
jgi:hypothetical protein